MNQRAADIILRWVAAIAVSAIFLCASAYIALIIGFSIAPQGPHRVINNWHILVIAVIVGLIGIFISLLILRRRPVSWWLLLSLPLPALIAFDQAGW